MAGGISGWWRNRVKNHRQKVMRKFLKLSDVKLGRLTRKRFLKYTDHKVSMIMVIIGAMIVSIGFVLIAFVDFFLEGHFNWVNIIGTNFIWLMGLFFLLIINALIMDYHNISISSATNNIGRMGAVIGPLSKWTDYHYYHAYSFSKLANLPFIGYEETYMFEDIDDWSDEDLGQFMRIVIGCLMIYVNDDGHPDGEVLNKLLKDIHAVQIFDGIKSRVTERRNARLKREKETKHRLDLERERARKASSASMAEEVKASLVHEEPDPSDPDVVRLNNIAESMRNKTEELRNAAQANKLRSASE